MNPKISVIVPAWNEEKHIAECLGSILSQTYKNLEIIIVDDGSMDGTIAVAGQIAGKDKRIKIICLEKSGTSVVRNTGLGAATGDLIHFADADDKLANADFYERIVAAAAVRQLPPCGGVGSLLPVGGIRNDCRNTPHRPANSRAAPASVGATKHPARGESGLPDIFVACAIDEKRPARPMVDYKRLKFYTGRQAKINASMVARRPAVWRFIYRREFLLENNLQFELGRVTSQDVMFTIPAIFYARSVVTVPGAYYWYRRNPDGAMRDPARLRAREENKKIIWDRAVRFAVDNGFFLGFRRSFWKWAKLKFFK